MVILFSFELVICDLVIIFVQKSLNHKSLTQKLAKAKLQLAKGISSI
jgi:hypothetical protein